MTRSLACALAIGTASLVAPSSAAAQRFVDVGVWTPGGGGRVVIGAPPPVFGPVYRAPRPVVVAPVYGPAPRYRHDRGRHLGWSKKGWGNDREYRRDVARAEAEYRRNVQRAEREYRDDIREADRDYRRGW
jgi:hypothetical protein